MSEKVLVYELAPDTYLEPSKGTMESAIEVMMAQLYHAKNLGATHIWLAPLYPSLRADYGYDIIDYCDIDRRYGTMGQFDHFVATAHRLGLKVLMDLVLNHTSVHHPWFRERPEFYCWSESVHHGWSNLFDGSYAWEWDIERAKFYLHLFHPSQADLHWFPHGRLNSVLVDKFRQIVRFWLEEHAIDGFRLDVPQAINKDFGAKNLELNDLIFGGKGDLEVLRAIFMGENAPKTRSGEKPFLIMECFDPTFGSLTEHYVNPTTPVDYVINAQIPEVLKNGSRALEQRLCLTATMNTQGEMLCLESHDTPRIASITDAPPSTIMESLFSSGANAICLYQGQELGLKNPDRHELSDHEMLRLDAKLAMQQRMNINDEPLSDHERLYSRANARVPFPLNDYRQQERDSHSMLHRTKAIIRRWKES